MDLKFGIVITLIVGVVSIQTDVNTEVYQRDCKLMFTYGYGYNKYFHISEAGTHKGRELTIRFLVRARSDAHLLLSPVQSPSEIMPVYEIVLGAGKNTFSDIRRLRRSSTRATSATKDLLSPIELRAFWVRLDNKGLIEVGKEGEDAPFLFWTDPTPLDIQYFSFCTWTGVVGKWLYDCPIANDTEKIEVVEEKPTTMTEKLRKDLLSNYDPYALPLLHADHRIIIFMHLIYHHVPQHWMDEKIRWNPNDYGGLTDVHIKEHEVWIPEIVLYNSIGHGANILGHSGMTITSEGAVMWSPSATLQVWCNINVSEWPNDEHTCELQLGFWTQREFLELLIVDNQTVMENEEKTRSEWKIVKMEAETLITAKPWIQDVDFDDDSSSPDSLTVRITVRRQSQHYHTLLETPLVVISMLMFLSFWMTPESSNKIGIICICLVLLALLIVTIGTLLPAPADHVPCLQLYSWLMVAGVVILLITTFITCITRYMHSKPPPSLLSLIVSHPIAQNALLLPKLNSEPGKSYNQLEESNDINESSADLSSRIITPSHQEIQQIWILIGTAVDRIACIIYIIFLIIILIKCN
uniref:Nicotinic acetylcholine receptor beta 2 subunit n=1 Tax=Blattella germanica TaxID=6973 RepID=A0A7T6C1Q0_BLAGE|nr:nicotinic acetylcholine receptor beta 2 subunit [Blattella germanica]